MGVTNKSKLAVAIQGCFAASPKDEKLKKLLDEFLKATDQAEVEVDEKPSNIEAITHLDETLVPTIGKSFSHKEFVALTAFIEEYLLSMYLDEYDDTIYQAFLQVFNKLAVVTAHTTLKPKELEEQILTYGKLIESANSVFFGRVAETLDEYELMIDALAENTEHLNDKIEQHDKALDAIEKAAE